MHNLINKFEAEVSEQDDAGVVAIEYVVVAGVVIAFGALLALFGTRITSAIPATL